MVPRRRFPFALAGATLALTVVSMQLLHCGGQSLAVRDAGNESDAGFEGGGVGDDAADGQSPTCICFPDANAPTPACANGSGWQCAVDTSCSSGSATALTGRVFDPAGANPLYNVVVFIPDDVATLPAITPGTNSCTACDVSIGQYVTATTTDETGAFTLQGVPTGADVPVTVQIGKWRRTTTELRDELRGRRDTAPTANPPGWRHAANGALDWRMR